MRALHAAHGFENPKQEVDFLSYRELLETLRVPPGREVTLPLFAAWCERHRASLRSLGALDVQALFEEFRGVIGAQPAGPLSMAEYLALGARQSLLDPAQREAAHALFQRYRAWLDEAGLHDSNLVAHAWRTDIAQVQPPVYDFVVIEEVQDLTPVQLALVLALLKAPGQFILCGDSHQIVHPNFFSWAALKSLFWHGQHAWIAPLAAAGFAPARGLMFDGEFAGAGTWLPPRYGIGGPWLGVEHLVRRTVAAVQQRHLQPYQAKNVKDILRAADVHGPDHATPVGATPLMLAATAGTRRWWRPCSSRVPTRRGVTNSATRPGSMPWAAACTRPRSPAAACRRFSTCWRRPPWTCRPPGASSGWSATRANTGC